MLLTGENAIGPEARPLSAIAGDFLSVRESPEFRRARRVVFLLLLIWVVGIFDLWLTLTAHSTGTFYEANPVARLFLDTPAALIAFKIGMIAFASLVFLVYRHHSITELSCWLLAFLHVGLCFLWMAYLQPLL